MKKIFQHSFIFPIVSILLYSCIQNPLSENKILEIHTIIKIQVDSNNNPIRKCFYKEYNNMNKLIKFIEYNEDGNYVLHNYTQIADNLTEEKLFYYQSNGSLDSQMINYNFYTLNNKIDRIVTLNHFGDTTKVQLFSYDSLGNVAVVTEVIPQLNIEFKTNYSYIYNTRGEILKISVHNTSNPNKTRFEEFSYFPNNSTINRSVYNSLGELQEVVTISYNKSGLIISETFTSREGRFLKKYLYEYTFR